MPQNKGPSIGIFRKILLIAFVIGVWIVFYWYQDFKYSNKEPASAPTAPTQKTPLTTKNIP